MAKFFVPGVHQIGDIINISGADAKHLTKVLRKAENDDIILCDAHQTDYKATILRVGDTAELKVIDKWANQAEPKIRVTIYQALPKGDKMEGIVKKCTELGISEIVPFKCARVIVKADEQKHTQRTAKWQRTADESVKQCMRGAIPKVCQVMNFNEMVALAKNHRLAIMAYELCESVTLRSVLSGTDADDIGIIIGPEGGFEPTEVELAADAGINIVTLGKRILRVETAAAAVLSAVMYHFNEF